MKLAFVAPGGFGRGGRVQVIPALISLTTELARKHEVHVFSLDGAAPITDYEVGGAFIHQIGDPARSRGRAGSRHRRDLLQQTYRLWRQMARISTEGPFAVVHAFWMGGPAVVAGLLGRLSGVPVVVSVGGGEWVWHPDIRYGGAGSVPGRLLARGSAAFADEITAGTSFARGFVDEGLRSRVTVVPLGIDCSAFDAQPARPGGPPWRLIHVGSINRVKDHATLLHAFKAVASRVPHVTLDCIGDDTLGGQVHALARELGVAEAVRFKGFVPNDELSQLYRAAHLNILSSRYESQGVVVLEAGAAGLPTVGSAVGILPDMAPDAASMVAPNDPEALAGAIVALLGDRNRRESLGAAAQRFARAHDVRATASAFEAIYERAGRPGSSVRQAPRFQS